MGRAADPGGVGVRVRHFPLRRPQCYGHTPAPPRRRDHPAGACKCCYGSCSGRARLVKFSFLSFGDLTTDPYSGHTPTAQERFAGIVEAAVHAEDLGHDGFGVGEHHGLDLWSLSAPPVLLGAIAARTSRIRLRTGVTLVPNLDPVRVAEDYASVDALSGGRFELTVGKGNFPQPWELFGQDEQEQRD